jgi:hypothetical protein
MLDRRNLVNTLRECDIVRVIMCNNVLLEYVDHDQKLALAYWGQLVLVGCF